VRVAFRVTDTHRDSSVSIVTMIQVGNLPEFTLFEASRAAEGHTSLLFNGLRRDFFHGYKAAGA